MPVFEYQCPNGHTQEKLVPRDHVTKVPCNKCAAQAKRILSATKTTFKHHDKKAIK
jgi:putative FmdB family regulatory protein